MTLTDLFELDRTERKFTATCFFHLLQ